MTDLAATVAMVGHQWVDHLVAARDDDPRLPMALLADPDLIPEPLVPGGPRRSHPTNREVVKLTDDQRAELPGEHVKLTADQREQLIEAMKHDFIDTMTGNVHRDRVATLIESWLEHATQGEAMTDREVLDD